MPVGEFSLVEKGKNALSFYGGTEKKLSSLTKCTGLHYPSIYAKYNSFCSSKANFKVKICSTKYQSYH